MAIETDSDLQEVHVDIGSNDDENSVQMDDDHLDEIREEDETIDNDCEQGFIGKHSCQTNLDGDHNDDQRHDRSDIDQINVDNGHENTNNKLIGGHKNDDDRPQSVNVDQSHTTIPSDTPLISKSDLVVINVSTSNQAINDTFNDRDKRSSRLNERVDDTSRQTDPVATIAASIEPTGDNGGGCVTTKEIAEITTIVSNGQDNSNKTQIVEHIELNDDHKNNGIDENCENGITPSTEPVKKKQKSSIWSKVWKSRTSDDQSNGAIKSNETSIEIVESPNKTETNGKLEANDEKAIPVVKSEHPETQKPDTEMIPTHLFIRVQSPYLKYIISFSIFVVLLFICALFFILFPSALDLHHITRKLILLNFDEDTFTNVVPIVDTHCGQYKGLLDENVAIFHGIPFAEPPIGDYRWRPATEPGCNTSSSIDAKQMRSFCHQKPLPNLNISYSEDCLYLNVWVPNWVNNEPKKSQPKPVFIYLSGDMITGYGSMDIEWLPYGKDVAKQYEAIYVTISYRFGVLGFLPSNILSKRSNGSLNYGLSDILMALKWINENIEYFGGSKHDVTLLGHGSSATLALAAATNDNGSKYLSRVWLSNPSPKFVEYNPNAISDSINKFNFDVGCQPNLTSQVVMITDLEKQIINCLLKVSPEKLVSSTPSSWFDTQSDLPSSQMNGKHTQIVVVDKNLIQSNPYSLIDSVNVEIVIGVNVEDSGAFSRKPDQLSDWDDKSEFTTFLQKQLSSVNPMVTDEIIDQYMNSTDYLSNEQIYHKLVTEIRYICPLFKSMQDVKNKDNVHIYINTYKPSHPLRYTADHSNSTMTVHGIDVIAMLNLLTKWFVIDPQPNDIRYIDTMRTELRSFIRTFNDTNLIDLSGNQINIITNDGKLINSSMPLYNCHRFWSAFDKFAKVN